MKFKILFLYLIFSTSAFAQTYRTDILTSSIKTLDVKVAGERLAPPVIRLGGQDLINISFDELSTDQTRYTYTVIHCNSDWKKSMLSPGEYMLGFQNQLIENYQTSYITTVDYTHYELFFPNDNVQFLASGNYAIIISKESEEDKPLAVACFSVVDDQVKVGLSVTSNTDIDFNKSHQQVSLSVNYPQEMSVNIQDFKVFVKQNNRRDNQIVVSNPSGFMPGRLVFEHNRNLIFNAGNEYRRFETISTKYNGFNIQSLQYFSPYFHETLYADEIRSRKSYLYEEDQDGKFFINAADTYDVNTEADYVIVHFTLPCEKPFLEKVYVFGDFYHNILDKRSELTYNYETKAYEKSELLKQGLYNYMYVTKNQASSEVSTELIEGNFYQTGNEYMVLVYYCPPTARYDRLVGMNYLKFLP